MKMDHRLSVVIKINSLFDFRSADCRKQHWLMREYYIECVFTCSFFVLVM